MKDIIVIGHLPKEIWSVLEKVKGAKFHDGYNEKRDAVLLTEIVHDFSHPDYYNQITALRSLLSKDECPVLYRDVFSDGMGRVVNIPHYFNVDTKLAVPFDIIKHDSKYKEAFGNTGNGNILESVSAKVILPKGTSVADRNFWVREYLELVRIHTKRNWMYVTTFDEDDEIVLSGQASSFGVEYEFTGEISATDTERTVEICFNYSSGNPVVISSKSENEDFPDGMLTQLQKFVDNL